MDACCMINGLRWAGTAQLAEHQQPSQSVSQSGLITSHPVVWVGLTPSRNWRRRRKAPFAEAVSAMWLSWDPVGTSSLRLPSGWAGSKEGAPAVQNSQQVPK